MLGHEIVYLVHILMVAPLFIYIGYLKENTPTNVLGSLLYMGIIVFLYHSYKLNNLLQLKYKNDNNIHDI